MASLFQLASLSTILAAILMFCINADLIDDICGQSLTALMSPSSCSETLRSNPRSRGGGADLQALAQIAIKKAKAATVDTVAVARSVLNSNNTDAVSVCSDQCGSAIDALNTVSKIMREHMGNNTKRYVDSRLVWAARFVTMCDTAFGYGFGNGEPSAEVKEASRIARGLINVVEIIGTMM